MKVTKASTYDRLEKWIEQRLPQSLILKRMPVGYGYCSYVYIKGHEPKGFMVHMFGGKGDPVAHIGTVDVDLYHPQYFADFEDLLRAYESETKDSIELKVWNG